MSELPGRSKNCDMAQKLLEYVQMKHGLMRMWESVRKFGLAYCDLPTMLTNVAFFLRILTLNIDTRNRTRIPIFFYILTVAFVGCYFYVYLVSMVWFVFGKCMETGDILAALIVFSLGISSEIGSVKLFCMFFYEKKAKKIVAQCLASDELVVPNSRFSNNLMKSLRHVKRRAIVFWLVIIGNGVVYIIKPILLPGRHLMEDIFIIYGLEPMFESPNYELAFIIMAMGVCVTVYLPANITAFLIIISGYVEAQMLALSEELLHLWEDAEKHKEFADKNEGDLNYNDSKDLTKSRNVAANAYVKQRLIAIIKAHSINITVIRDMENVFRGAIAIEFALLIVALIAELLGGLENTYMEIPYALMQVAMDCLTGQRLMDASTAFERAVYDCRWEMFDNNNMKLVLLMLQNSQKTMTVTAGGVIMLSFTSLMSVIRSIYSAYTTLRTTMK